MKWSWRMGQIAGISIFIHWTFLILIGWIVFLSIERGQNFNDTAKGIAFILSIFACVLLHELGHALAARRYDIPTRDITLLPIGGVARLERMPEEPKQELVVAIAGPLVNAFIATFLFIIIEFIYHVSDIYPKLALIRGDFLVNLMWVNITLVIFNLLPAFPMDGGRILRAILAQRFEYVHATQIAASIGQFMAIMFGILGFFSNWFLLFISLFVYLGAAEEAHMVKIKSVFKGVPVREAMVTRFSSVHEKEPVSVVVKELLNSCQQDFPIVSDSGVVGIITRNDLIRTLAEGKMDIAVSDIMQKNCPLVDEREMLEDVFKKMREGNISTLPVIRSGDVVGIITLENLGEWMMIQSALRKAKARHEIEDIFNLK